MLEVVHTAIFFQIIKCIKLTFVNVYSKALGYPFFVPSKSPQNSGFYVCFLWHTNFTYQGLIDKPFSNLCSCEICGLWGCVAQGLTVFFCHFKFCHDRRNCFQFSCKTSISNFELTLIHIPMFTMFAPEVEPMGEAGTSFISAQ